MLKIIPVTWTGAVDCLLSTGFYLSDSRSHTTFNKCEWRNYALLVQDAVLLRSYTNFNM